MWPIWQYQISQSEPTLTEYLHPYESFKQQCWDVMTFTEVEALAGSKIRRSFMVSPDRTHAPTCQEAKTTSITRRIRATKAGGLSLAVIDRSMSALQQSDTLAVVSHNTKLCQLTRSLNILQYQSLSGGLQVIIGKVCFQWSSKDRIIHNYYCCFDCLRGKVAVRYCCLKVLDCLMFSQSGHQCKSKEFGGLGQAGMC